MFYLGVISYVLPERDVPLTAVAPPRRAVGRAAVELIVRRLQEGESHIMRHLHLLPRLNVRASTVLPGAGTPRPDDPSLLRGQVT